MDAQNYESHSRYIAKEVSDMRVLLAGTNERNLEIVQAYLWEAGHEAEIAIDGLECLTGLRAIEPDVLVRDHDLLERDEDDVIARMCCEPGLASVPVILVGDEVRPLQPDHLTFSPVIEIQRRPVLLSNLLERINSVSRRQRHLEATAQS